MTHAFDALSFMFPQGEKFFIRVAKEVSQKSDVALTPALKEDLKAFIEQEAMHTKHHQSYNRILESHGYQNVVQKFIDYLDKTGEKYLAPMHKLAIVCAWEHFTAVLGDYLLKNPHAMESAPSHVSLIWGWHAAEETEHKAVCFDLYRAVGGSWVRRVSAFLLVCINFLLIFSNLYGSMLWRDGCLNWRRLPRTIYQSTVFFWGRHGVGWHVLTHGLKYLSPRFHPWQQDNRDLLKTWLIRNHSQLKEVVKH